MTFNEYAKTWEATILPLAKPATIATIKSHIRKLEGINATQIDSLCQPAQKFFTELSRSLAAKSVRNVHSTFHNIMASALREGFLPRSARPEQRWLTLEEMRALITEGGPQRPLYSLLAETGLRIGEALGLQVGDIDLSKATIMIRRSIYAGETQEPKTTASKRTLTASLALLKILAPEGLSEDFLFRASNGSPLWPGKLLMRLRQLTIDLRMAPSGFHGFRRGNGTLLCSVLGISEKIAAYRLGHEAPGLTLGRYAQTFAGMDREVAPRLGELLFGGSEPK